MSMKTIRGSAAGTIPWTVYTIMKQQARELTFGELFALFPDGTSRGALSYAMNDLGKRGVVKTSGPCRSMLYSLTDVELPLRSPMAPYWKKPKGITVAKPKLTAVEKITKPKGKPGPKTAESHFDGNEFLRLPKFRTPQAPELVCCKSCEFYGPEKGCPDCKYVLPNERIAA